MLVALPAQRRIVGPVLGVKKRTTVPPMALRVMSMS
jgi:hypothetical protein